jgi:hypothetical protein
MFNLDLIYRARWDQLYTFFTDGYPPLVLKLLIINTIFMVLFIYRRARAKHPLRPTSAYTVQGLLIATNALVMFQNDVMGLATRAQTILHF